MRVKHKKWAEPLIEAHPEKITTDPAQFKGKWQSRFAKEQPIWLEVGMARGSLQSAWPRRIRKLILSV